MQRVLVTGSEGKIGSVIVPCLKGRYSVFSTDRIPLDREDYKEADIADAAILDCVFAWASPECVIHLAADSRVEAPWDSALKNNIEGTSNVYKAAKKHGAKRVIFASSNHVSGGDNGYPKDGLITVADAVRPDGFYAVSKVFGEALARLYYDAYGLSSVCIRIGSMHSDNDPFFNNGRYAKIWISHRDMSQLMEKSIEAPVGFGIYYGVSGNTGRFVDISNAEKELGYKPLDNAFSK